MIHAYTCLHVGVLQVTCCMLTCAGAGRMVRAQCPARVDTKWAHQPNGRLLYSHFGELIVVVNLVTLKRCSWVPFSGTCNGTGGGGTGRTALERRAWALLPFISVSCSGRFESRRTAAVASRQKYPGCLQIPDFTLRSTLAFCWPQVPASS